MADTSKPKPEEKPKEPELFSEPTKAEPTSAPDLPESVKDDISLASNADGKELTPKEDEEEPVNPDALDDTVEDIEIDEVKDAANDPQTTKNALGDLLPDVPEKPTAGDAFKTPEEAAAEDASKPEAQPVAPATMPIKQDKSFKHWLKTHKKTTVLLVLVIIIAVLAAIPLTRYKIAGTFLRQTQTIQVLDSQTNQPVTGAKVMVGDRTKTTDSKGKVALDPKVGNQNVSVQKANYASSTSKHLVPILKPKNDIQVHLKATGRQVGVKVVNSITGKPVENATFKIDGSEFKINDKGLATVVAPADSKELDATISANGYVTSKAKLLVNAQTLQIQTYKLTPSGKVYFLSNLSGKLDVVKANLDGTARQTILAGTGNEDAKGTALLASRDWKYLALLSRRDGGKTDKVFLINTSNDKVSTIDEGDVSFKLTGWDGHNIVYTVFRYNKQVWEAGRQAIKSFNADSGKMVTLDENQVVGDQSNYGYQALENPYITSHGIAYLSYWEGSGNSRTILSGKTNALRSVSSDGKDKKDIKSFDGVTTGAMLSRLYAPDEIYVGIYDYDKKGQSFYEYEDGSFKEAPNVTNNVFFEATYPTYLLSPSGKQTFWGESRDGKNSLFVGDANGKNQQQVASLSDYTAYGWFSDDYLLVSKNSSELYIMPKSGGTPLKITDYYKPNLNFAGYGYGYGGL